MSEVQQQIADGARPRLARVGDRIEHGETIPANVVRFADNSDDAWWRTSTNPLKYTWIEDDDDPYGLDEIAEREHFYPMTVVEVDPVAQPVDLQPVEQPRHAFAPGEDGCCDAWLLTGSPPLTGKVRCGNVREAPCHLQPAARTLIGPPHAHQDRPCTDACYEPAVQQPASMLRKVDFYDGPESAESAPVVLTLPEAPPDAVALYGLRTGTRYKVDAVGVWRVNSWDGDLADVLRREHPEGARVEMAPPREPRVWPKLDAAALVALDEFPDVVDLIEPNLSPLRFERTAGLRGVVRYIEPGHPECSFTLDELRQLGEVREVLT